MSALKLSRDEKAEVVAVLSAAFNDYPVMRFVLRTTGDEYEKQLNALVGFFCEVRLLRQWPVLGIRKDGSLVAAALVNEPVREPLTLPEEQLKELRSIIGNAAYQRLESYEEKSSGGEPAEPHHFLGMIGVLPDHRGKGYAADLLRVVKEMSVADPASAGVCLSTEDSRNVSLYQRFGYRILAEVDVDGLHSWCMFLPTR